MLPITTVMQAGCRQPLSKPNGWLFWGILGVIAAPFVVGACATLIQAVGYEVRQLAGCSDALMSITAVCHKF